MPPVQGDLLRRSVVFWIIFPAVSSFVLIFLPELIGRFIDYEMGNPLFGLGGLMMWIGFLFAPFAAHVVMIASLVGIVTLFMYRQFDWRLVLVIIFGMFVSGVMLFRLYFAGF